jgi:hypothetical protein
MLVVRRAVDDASVAEQHFELERAVVHQPVAVRGGLDADARHRAAQRDGLQLRHHRGHDALREARLHQVLVGDHAFRIEGARSRVHRQHVAERAHVQPPRGAGRAVAEQVGRVLRQPDRAACEAKLLG